MNITKLSNGTETKAVTFDGNNYIDENGNIVDITVFNKAEIDEVDEIEHLSTDDMDAWNDKIFIKNNCVIGKYYDEISNSGSRVRLFHCTDVKFDKALVYDSNDDEFEVTNPEVLVPVLVEFYDEYPI